MKKLKCALFFNDFFRFIRYLKHINITNYVLIYHIFFLIDDIVSYYDNLRSSEVKNILLVKIKVSVVGRLF
jgi:hypothetical protein